MNRPMPTVIIAGDIPFLISLVRIALEDEGFTVLDECTSPENLMISVARMRPQVVFLDLGLEEFETIRTIEDLLDIEPTMAIIAVTEQGAGQGEKMLAAGAMAYLLKPFSMYDLVDIIRKVTPMYGH